MIKIEVTKPFKLNDTVTCGQIFRFFPLDDGSFDIIIKDRVINVYMEDSYLCVSSNNEDSLEEVVINYFDLNNDYEVMNEFLIKNDEKIKSAVEFSSGLMMIKQDPFETVMSYIISANNGVPQIASALNNIAKNYGEKVIFSGEGCYSTEDAVQFFKKELKDFVIHIESSTFSEENLSDCAGYQVIKGDFLVISGYKNNENEKRRFENES